METTFRKLNLDWNAEPNSPDPRVRVSERAVALSFLLNSFAFDQFNADDVGVLTFSGCSRYLLGGANDEGWRLNQCRFSKLVPAWGEFYEVFGNLRLNEMSDAWHVISQEQRAAHHYLFYLRDETFECTAVDWAFTVVPHGAEALGHAV